MRPIHVADPATGTERVKDGLGPLKADVGRSTGVDRHEEVGEGLVRDTCGEVRVPLRERGGGM
ncbi:hypothetical protein [Streptomyces axinellae]|uniref:hypothetical protein n=1 Tax=Streptomyces axinellae TaxID=552788 RepID=UPI003CD08D95